MNAQEGRVPGKRVLIVDDSVDTARMMKVLLKFEGHDVRIAHEGREALTLAREFLPDVVLLDLIMPGMSGHEVAEAMRDDSAVSRTLIVGISGYDNDGVPPGFDHLLVKPVDHGVLLKLLASTAGKPEDLVLSSGDARVAV